jgi:uncharacterized protein
MFKKLFNLGAEDEAEPVQVERNLAAIATRVPSVRWAALVSSNGLLKGLFPSQLELGADTIAAMSAAMLSLGERISAELRHGDLQYTFTVGEKGGTLVLILNQNFLLSLGLEPDASLQKLLETLPEEIIPLLHTLQIENPSWYGRSV